MRVGVDLKHHLPAVHRCVVGAAVFDGREFEGRAQGLGKAVGGDMVVFPLEYLRRGQAIHAVFDAPIVLDNGVVGAEGLADAEGAEFGPDAGCEGGGAEFDAEQAGERQAGGFQGRLRGGECRRGFQQAGERVAVIGLMAQEDRKIGVVQPVFQAPDVERVSAFPVQAAEQRVAGKHARGVVQATAAGIAERPVEVGGQHALPVGQALDVGEDIGGAVEGLGDKGGLVGHGADHRQGGAVFLAAQAVDGVEMVANGEEDDHLAAVIAGPGPEAVAMDFGFFPDAGRVLAIDAGVRGRLADSLDTAFGVVEGAGLPLAALRELSAAIRAHAIRPGVIALYGDLLPALMGEDEASLAGVVQQLAMPCWREPAGFRIVTLDDAELGPGMAERYRGHVQDDPEHVISLLPVEGDALREGRRRVAGAMALLAAAAPALHAEIDALINEIVLVKSQAGAGTLAFHGASSFFLWGALALNLAQHGSRVKLVEGIVHEAAHCLLHGFTLGGPMTANAGGELHVSPLREDLRPMEGLVHAAYVLARMHLAMGALLQPALLADGHVTAAERAEAAQRYAGAAQNFCDAQQTIAVSAAFTPVGAAVFAAARAYMRD